MGLDNIAFGGVLLSLSISKARFVLISRYNPCTSLHDELLEVKKESSPKQEEEVSIATLQTFQFYDLAIHPKPVVLQNPLREEEILLLKIFFNDDFGRSINFPLHKRSFIAYSLNLLKKGSLRKHSKSNPIEGYLERLKDGMSSDAIVGEQSHLEDNPILSPSMPTLDDFYEPTIEPILDLDESSNALSPKPPNELRNPSTHLTHRNHLDHKDDREEQHQWLKSIKTYMLLSLNVWMRYYITSIQKVIQGEFWTFMTNHPWKWEMIETSMSKEATS